MRFTVVRNCGAVAALAMAPMLVRAAEPEPTLKIIHFNVGVGDATLLVVDLAGGKTAVLIDGGSVAMAGKVVIPGLLKAGVKELNVAIATDYDCHHRDGLEAVVRSFPLKEGGIAYDRDRAWPSQDKGTKNDNRPLQPGSTIQFGDLKIKCIAANGMTANWTGPKPAPDENSQSIALKIEFHDFKYFIGGDLTGGGPSGWSRTLDVESHAAKDTGQVSVLRVNRHGSVASTNQTFLGALSPTVAIISTGRDGTTTDFMHLPAPDVLGRLTGLASLSAIYLTGDVEMPKALSDEAKKKVKNGAGDVIVSTTGRGTFEVNGVSYKLSSGSM